MAAWITPADVAFVYGACDITSAFIEHIQGLASLHTGPVDTPSPQLKAVFIEIVYRRSLAGDDNIQGETLGNYTYQRAATTGQGLTNREARLLARAAGRRRVGTVGVGGGVVETPPARHDRLSEVDW